MYVLETFYGDKWLAICSDTSRTYLDGYLESITNHNSIRPPYRIVNKAGKVIRETPAVSEPSVGQIAGRPTLTQLKTAAIKALKPLLGRQYNTEVQHQKILDLIDEIEKL
jgi:hypothetical protein